MTMAERSLARKSTAPTRSWGSTILPMGISATVTARRSGSLTVWGHHVGVGRAWGDGVDADPLQCPFHGQGLGQADHPVLARNVSGRDMAPGNDEGELRGGVDDPAPSRLHHFPGGGLATEEHAPQVDIVEAVPLLGREVQGRAANCDPGVVDHDVEAAFVSNGL